MGATENPLHLHVNSHGSNYYHKLPDKNVAEPQFRLIVEAQVVTFVLVYSQVFPIQQPFSVPGGIRISESFLEYPDLVGNPIP